MSDTTRPTNELVPRSEAWRAAQASQTQGPPVPHARWHRLSNRPKVAREPVSPGHLPPDVLALVREHGLGFNDLKVLLLLHEDAAKRWTASTLAAQLGLPEAWVEGSLEHLRAAALLVADGHETERRFFYCLGTPAIEATLARLAQISEERPADVIRALNNDALERVRLAASRAFRGFELARGRGDSLDLP
jgi:hypothetical protein